MEVELFLAKFWGLYLVIVSAAFLINKHSLDSVIKLTQDRSFMLMTGFMSLILGLASLILQNSWSLDWLGLITLLGWLALLKGVARFVYPEGTVKLVKSFKSDTFYYVAMVITLLLGAYLAYVGFYF